jgi:hypothetical protein
MNKASGSAVGLFVVLATFSTAIFPTALLQEVVGGQCTPGPSPCRATNSVQCLGVGCQGNWDECLVGNENEPYTCHGAGGLNDNGGPPSHCPQAGCTLTCSELCLDANGDAAGDINAH